jgi:hypothetical protein
MILAYRIITEGQIRVLRVRLQEADTNKRRMLPINSISHQILVPRTERRLCFRSFLGRLLTLT